MKENTKGHSNEIKGTENDRKEQNKHNKKKSEHQKILESFREFIHVMVPHGDYTKLEKNFLRPLMENFEVDLSEVKEIKTLEEYQRPVSKEVYLKESEGRGLRSNAGRTEKARYYL